MRIWKRVKMAAFMAKAGWSGQSFDFSNWMGRTFWGIDNSQLANNETIFSVISRLSNTLAALPIKLHQDYQVISNQASDVLINEPNQNMSSFDLINALEVSRNETGNGYALILRDIRMQPYEILPLDPSAVTPFVNRDDGLMWYEVRGEKGRMYVSNADMLHVKHIRGPGRLVGLSPLKVLANTIKYDKAVQEFSLSEMEKKESFILKYAANVDNEKRTKIIEDFRRFYAENGGILFQEPGVELTEIAKKYFAADTINSEKITRTRVANVYNVPISFLNEQGGSFGSNEQMMIQFVQMTLLPIVKQYEQEFNRKLLVKADRLKGMYFKFNLGGLLRGDTAARTAFYQMMVRTAGMKPNEVRELEDLPPDVSEEANKLYISGDLYPLDMDPSQRKGSSKTSEGGENSE